MRKGDTVRVFLPEREQTISSTMRQFHGIVSTIRSVYHIKSYTVYTLDGCKSRFGEHYSFLPEWLILIEERDSNDTV